jgi:hypothetical protein
MSSNANARERRAGDRRRRRGEEEAPQNQTEPFDDAAKEAGTTQLPDALKAAASAAVVGAAVGAARAYSNRRHAGDEEELEEHPPEHEEDETATESTAETSTPETPPSDGAQLDEREGEPSVDNGRASDLAAPASRDTLREVVAQARGVLQDLRGVDAESVSSATRTPDGWTVGLEVLELRRIPDSTDILASYEIELDQEGSLLRFERVRRYHRSEADRGGD